MVSTEVLQKISKDVGISPSRVQAVVQLLAEGATVPFIARYRKDATGNLEQSRIREIAEQLGQFKELDARREVILAALEKVGQLTDELRQKLQGTASKAELEDTYLPFKSKRKSKARIASERGLLPLADYIWEQAGTEQVENKAQEFVNLEKGLNSLDEALEGAVHILAERVAENPKYREMLRHELFQKGMVRAHVMKGKEGEKTKYEMYYAFEELVPEIPSHRVLAIRRGTREGVLTYAIDIERDRIIEAIAAELVKDRTSSFNGHIERAIRDGFERLLEPAIQTEVKGFLRERAESDAIRVFEDNLRTLLLAPPAGPISVLGMNPGVRMSCRIAAVDPAGKLLEAGVLNLFEPKKDLEAAEKTLVEFIDKHNIRGIAIGNGSASRETELFVRSVLAKAEKDIFTMAVNESGVSAYAASKAAREEFPSLDVPARGAISLARRLQDPLAELVKVDPKSIGVGQYQHDVDQKRLKHSLSAAVESAVNRVGVELNSATVDLLRYVSGVGEPLAASIVAFRAKNGEFKFREQLKAIEGFSEKAFEQCAGFLRIAGAENPLERTSIHPESYSIVEKLAVSIEIGVGELLHNAEKIQAVPFRTFEAQAGRFNLGEIREVLLNPAYDQRGPFVVPKFRDDLKGAADLAPGMELEGTVTNVTNFGAFVDLGVQQDGLVHISELAHKFVQDARQAVKVGDVVKVKVIGFDAAMKRISLSMKALQPKPPRRPKRKPVVVAKPQPPADVAPPPPLPVPNGPDGAPVRPKPQARPARPQQPRPPRPEGSKPQGPRPPRPEGDRRPERQDRPPRPPREMVAQPPQPPLSMEEKIRLLKEKFSGTR